MLELLIFGSGAAVGALALVLPYTRARNDRDVLQAAKDSLAVDVEALKAHVSTLRDGRDRAVSLGITEATRLGKIIEEAERAKGRIEAELVAANQRLAKFERARGKGGRFTKKVEQAPKPIACA